MFETRVTVLVGPYGGGKTEIALNGALAAAGKGVKVALVDMDVVKPYFRSRAARRWIGQRGVRVVAPAGPGAFADMPIITPDVRAVLGSGDWKVIVDAGGDDAGSRVLGSLHDAMPGDGEARTLLVLNFNRPFAGTVDQVTDMARTIRDVSRLRLDGVVSNTHMMDETTPQMVVDGYRLAMEACARLGVAVVAVTVDESLAREIDPAVFDCPIVPLHRWGDIPFEGAPAS